MVLDKALLLKGLAGVAAVGGTVGGGIAYKSLSSSKKEAEGKEVEAPNAQVGTGGTHANSNPINNTNQEDELGLTPDCEVAKSCDLDENSIKKVKFQDLGEGSEQVTVSPDSGLKINLEIKGDGETKRYIFKNSDSEVTLQKGSKKLILKGNGKTRFIKESKKLKKLETATYGLPTRCKENIPCNLIDDDLEQVKFEGFTDGGETTVEVLSDGQTVSLTKENNKYIFTNNSSASVTVKNGDITVDLDQGETDFIVVNDKLKKVELWEFGLPESCKLEDTSDSQTCTLTPRDLKKVKFKDIGDSPIVSNDAGNVTLKIEKIDDSSYPDKRKYTFTPDGSNDVTISGTPQPITLSKTEKNIFKKEKDIEELFSIPKRTPPTFTTTELDGKIDVLGLPKTCTFKDKSSGDQKSIECELSHQELKNLKFSVGDITSATGGQENGNNGYHTLDPKTYRLKIEDANNEKQFESQNIRIIFLNKGIDTWSSDLVISGNAESENTITIINNTDTEFKINSQNKLEKAWSDSALSDLVGLKCPKEEGGGLKCTLKDDGGSIKVFIDNQPKDFKPTSKDDVENNMTYGVENSEYGQGFKFDVKNKISGTNKDNSGETLELEKDSYEIKRFSDHGWRFTKRTRG